MFLSFFYLLRDSGLSVSLNEWMMLMEGLNQGLHGSTFWGFYVLCKSVLVHSEIDYDKFDQIFFKYFGETEERAAVTEAMMNWLKRSNLQEQYPAESNKMSQETIERLFAKRLKDQDKEHNGGKHWIGTGGYTSYGNQGKRKDGIRVGSQSTHQSAYRAIGERKYRDWRWDNTLDSRQYQIAFRRLRQLMSDAESNKKAFDINATIRKTCDRAGRLQIEYSRPKRNGIKVLLLIDSGGSMEPYQRLCSMLFQSVQKAGDFKELKIYYFHNVLRKNVFVEPTCDWRSGVSLEWVLSNTPGDYRVIFVGDAVMAPDELLSGKPGNTGLDNFEKVKSRYAHSIWLHPQPRPAAGGYFTKSFEILNGCFEMYQLTIEGLGAGMKKLIANR